MFELIPFNRTIRGMSNYDPFRDFDEMERRFFDDTKMVKKLMR